MLKKSLIVLAPLTLSLLISGCAEKAGYIASKEHTLNVLKETKKIEDTQKYTDEDHGIFKEYSLPNYLGASPVLTKREYFLKKFNKEPLLFNNFGVQNYVYILLDTNDWNKAEIKAKNLGYKNVKDMYNKIHKKLISSNEEETLSFLEGLNKKDILDINYVMNPSNIERKTDKIIYEIYGPYLKYEGITEPKILKQWYANIDDDKIYFSRLNYKPYALTILIMENMLKEKIDLNKERMKKLEEDIFNGKNRRHR